MLACNQMSPADSPDRLGKECVMKKMPRVFFAVLLLCFYVTAHASDTTFSKRATVDSKQTQTRQNETQQMIAPQLKEAVKLKPQTQTGTPNSPDLQVGSITFNPGNPQSGTAVTVSVTVWNTGTVVSAPAMVKLVMSATHPPQGSNPPAFTATTQIDPVTPNMAKVATYSIQLTNAIQGQWNAEVTVDVENTVQEGNEANNQGGQLFMIY